MQYQQNHTQKRGVILIISLLVMAAISAALLAGAFSSQGQLKNSILQNEAEKARQDAQAKLEGELNKVDTNNGTANTLQIQRTQVKTNFTNNAFKTPKIANNDAYTLYLTGYDSKNAVLGANGSVTLSKIEFTSGYLEATIISEAGIKKYIFAKAGSAPNGFSAGDRGNRTDVLVANDGAVNITLTGQLAVFRIIGAAGTQNITFTPGATGLPSQGDVVTATGQEGLSNVKAGAEIYQSYPQIPAAFLVTGI